MNDNSFRVIEVDINEILPNRFQPRIQFDEEEILELSDSIKEHGVIQPIVVRTIGNRYEIIAGERRYKASVLAGKETVPVIIKNLNDRDSAEIALIENIQRKNLTPIEEALSYKKILDMGYLTQEKLADKIGKSQSSVANKIRLLNLSDEVQEALLDNKISERHARSLLKLKSNTDQNNMLDRIINERLTVRRADEEIQKVLSESPKDDIRLTNKEQKEEGELTMNNENNQSTVQPQGNTFDIFGGIPSMPVVTPMVEPQPVVQPAAPVVPVMEPIVASMPTMPTITPMVEPQPVVQPMAPVVPVMEPIVTSMPTMPAVTPMVEPQSVVQPMAPVVPVMEPIVASMPTMPTITPIVEPQPVVQPGEIQFDANGNVISAPIMEPMAVNMPDMPSIPTSEIQENNNLIPEMAPIVESNSFPSEPQVQVEMPQPIINNVQEQPEDFNISSPVTPQPIIITDYNKQYDPVMPNVVSEQITKVDFKEIVSAIRECSAKIEKYGYKIDVEEYDLSTLYQVVFKIEK